MKRPLIWICSFVAFLGSLIILQRAPITDIPTAPNQPYSVHLHLTGWPWVSEIRPAVVDANGFLNWELPTPAPGNNSWKNLVFCSIIALLAAGSVACFLVPSFPRYSILTLLFLVTATSFVAALYSLDLSVFGKLSVAISENPTIQVSNSERPLYHNGIAFVPLTLAIYFFLESCGWLLKRIAGETQDNNTLDPSRIA